MSNKNTIKLTKEDIILAISKTTTMGGAAKYLKISDRTFKKEALKHKLYKPVKQNNKKFALDEIVLHGKHPQYPTSKLLKRLVEESYKDYKCEECGITEYNSKHISLEIDHIDGDNSNHHINNLRVLCPNCHSQTPTYRSKKIKWRRVE